MTFSNYFASADPLFTQLGLMKFTDLIHFQNALLIHRKYHQKVPSPLQKTFAVDFSHSHNTRANARGLINFKLVRTSSFGTKSIRHQAVLSWQFCHDKCPSIKLLDLTENELKSTLKKALIN